MPTKVEVDWDKCIGAGLCTIAARHFELGDTGKVVLLTDGIVDDEDLADVSDALAVCPTQALRFIGDD